MKWWGSLFVIIVIIHDEPWCHQSVYGDGQWTSPYICTNNDGHERSITKNCCCSYEMVTVTIHHYNQYSWQTLNVTTTHILLATPPFVTFNFLVTEAIVHCHGSYEMVTVTICRYKSLLVTNLECHHNTYTFGDATFCDVQCLVTEALLTVTNELMVTFFDPHWMSFFSCRVIEDQNLVVLL